VGIPEVVFMKVCTSTKRVGGKTVKVDIEVVNDTIVKVVISGDFFLYPEEAIHDIESRLTGRKVSEVASILDGFRGSVEFLGASIDDLVSAVIDAYTSCQE
jgi:hypothetical protein